MFRTRFTPFTKFTLLLIACTFVFGLARYFPVEAAAKTYYVATNGNDSYPGTEAQPFATMQKAVNVMVAGDTALVKNGTYTKYADVGAFVRFTKSGTQTAWITLKAYPGHKPKIVSPVWNAFLFERASYIEVNGFELQGVASTISKNNANGIVANYSHHIVIKNNDIYDFPGGGIGNGWSDFIVVENNKVHNTSKLSTYATSAISFYQLTNVNTYSGYHNIIRGNIVYDNANVVGKITDGNCIIIDRSRHPDANDVPVNPYTGRTLIENNICFNNGGRGIHVYRSDYVYATHNTLYMNQYTTGMDGSELSALYSGNSEFYNNIVYTLPGKIANNAWKANNIKYGNNLYFNAKGVNPVTSSDMVGVDPQFVAASINPAVANFRLKSTSPAIDKSVGAYIPGYDLDRNRRPSGGSAELGAYEYMGTQQPSVPATPTPQPATPVAPTPTPPTGPAMLLDVQPANATVGQPVKVNLQLKSMTNVYGLDVKCNVNPAVLTGAGRTDGTIFAASNSFFVDGGYKADGSWAAASSLLNPAPAFTGDGVAFSLGYTVTAAGSSDVKCTATGVDRNGSTLQMTVVNSVFTVGGAAVAAREEVAPVAELGIVTEIVPMDTAFDQAALMAPAAPVVTVASVSGMAAFQNRTSQTGIIVQLFSGETALAELVTNADGGFNFTDVPDGTYTLQVSGPQSLTVRTDVTIVGGQAVNIPVLSLPGGDTDNSSLVDLSDAALIGANYSLSIPPGPAEADLNGDGVINIADLVLVGSNYGSTGPIMVAATTS